MSPGRGRGWRDGGRAASASSAAVRMEGGVGVVGESLVDYATDDEDVDLLTMSSKLTDQATQCGSVAQHARYDGYAEFIGSHQEPPPPMTMMIERQEDLQSTIPAEAVAPPTEGMVKVSVRGYPSERQTASKEAPHREEEEAVRVGGRNGSGGRSNICENYVSDGEEDGGAREGAEAEDEKGGGEEHPLQLSGEEEIGKDANDGGGLDWEDFMLQYWRMDDRHPSHARPQNSRSGGAEHTGDDDAAAMVIHPDAHRILRKEDSDLMPRSAEPELNREPYLESFVAPPQRLGDVHSAVDGDSDGADGYLASLGVASSRLVMEGYREKGAIDARRRRHRPDGGAADRGAREVEERKGGNGGGDVGPLSGGEGGAGGALRGRVGEGREGNCSDDVELILGSGEGAPRVSVGGGDRDPPSLSTPLDEGGRENASSFPQVFIASETNITGRSSDTRSDGPHGSAASNTSDYTGVHIVPDSGAGSSDVGSSNPGGSATSAGTGDASQEWPHNVSLLPDASLVLASGPVCTRTSLRSLVMKKWHPSHWARYGPHQILVFRSQDHFDDWLRNPYHAKRQRDYLVKLRIDFYGEMAKEGSLGHRILPWKAKNYGRNEPVMFQFKLERWTNLGVTVIAAFASQDENDVRGLHETIDKCLKGCPHGGLRNIEHMLKK